MKYLLINQQTGKETLCEKVSIDEFDYYVSDELPKDNKGYWIYIGFNEPLEVIKSNQPIGWFEKLWDKNNYKTPIATNNPNIDIPQVVNDVEPINIAFKHIARTKDSQFDRGVFHGFVGGYKKSQETHPFSQEDMIEFATWISENDLYKPSIEELLQLWKYRQQQKIYYTQTPAK